MNRRTFLTSLAPCAMMSLALATKNLQAMEKFLQPTAYIDSTAPTIVATVRSLISSTSDARAKAVLIHDFVREEVKFGLSSDFYDQPASAVLAARVGYCNTKGTLFVAMLRAAGIPARQHFVDINADILYPLIRPGTPFVDHSFVEVWLSQRWIALDSYIIDRKLFVAAKAKLAEQSKTLGFGIHHKGRIDWDGTSPAFSQYLNDGSVPNLTTHDHGVHADVGAFYASAKRHNQFNSLVRLGFGFLARSANNRIEALRIAA